MERPLCKRDGRFAPLRIILGERTALDTRLRADLAQHEFGDIADRDLLRVAKITWARELGGTLHEQVQAVTQTVTVAEGTRLPSVAVERYRLVFEGLDDEVGDDAPVILMHARPVGVEDTSDLD